MESRPGIVALESLRTYVHDLERSTRFYLNRLGFALVHESRRDGAHERTFRAGSCTVACASPIGEGEPRRFLERHPDGIGEVVFRVRSAERAFRWLEDREATAVEAIAPDHDGRLGFAIATPFGRCLFRFVEGEPEATPLDPSPYVAVDHLTANAETMAPAALWLTHVLGFTEFWRVALRTRPDGHGTGLRSRVLIDRESGLKIALNEPSRPNFHGSQIDAFVDDHHGPGFQHAALAVKDLPATVEGLRAHGVEFLGTPDAYYDALPERLRDLGLGAIEEPIERLRALGLLVDGAGDGRYLLQIFLRDAAALYHEKEAGPFFFELIERKGDPGFGEGNFRALFESLERDQAATRGAA